MIFRQIKMFIYKAKIYIKKHHVRKSPFGDLMASKDVLDIAKRARQLHEVSILLKRFRRTNSFKLLMD